MNRSIARVDIKTMTIWVALSAFAREYLVPQTCSLQALLTLATVIVSTLRTQHTVASLRNEQMA